MIYQRWRHETSPSMCCQGGKVTVPAYPPPPPELMRLWFEDSSEARLFRQHSRSINNATALSSFVVNERRQESGTSSVYPKGRKTNSKKYFKKNSKKFLSTNGFKKRKI